MMDESDTTYNVFILLIVGFVIFMFIYARYEDYKENKKQQRFKYLTGKFRHFKTPAGIIVEVEHRTKTGKTFFKKALKEEISYLRLNKYL